MIAQAYTRCHNELHCRHLLSITFCCSKMNTNCHECLYVVFCENCDFFSGSRRRSTFYVLVAELARRCTIQMHCTQVSDHVRLKLVTLIIVHDNNHQGFASLLSFCLWMVTIPSEDSQYLLRPRKLCFLEILCISCFFFVSSSLVVVVVVVW